MKVRCIKFTPLKGLIQPYLTEGKIYDVYEASEYAFQIRDDEDDELFVLWENSLHGVFEKLEN